MKRLRNVLAAFVEGRLMGAGGVERRENAVLEGRKGTGGVRGSGGGSGSLGECGAIKLSLFQLSA
eukprot:299164-Rhodomonas_salina.3